MGTWRALHDYRSSIALENEMALAGCALGCSFSSSEEFEADVISQRRAAGRYGANMWPSILSCVALLALGAAAVLF
jgi:hypothetical protein